MSESAIIYPSVVFGSENSVDLDKAYVFPEMPCVESAQQFALADPQENRNIIVVENGVVKEAFKGAPDETNNAIFYTSGLHPQTSNEPIITRSIQRIVPLKVVRCVRILLAMASRSQYRDVVITALNHEQQSGRAAALRKIDFDAVDLDCNMLKTIAFQLGQTLALIDEIELYTKTSIAERFPELRPFLLRQTECENNILNAFRDRLIEKIRRVYTRKIPKSPLNLFCVNKSVSTTGMNEYERQTHGIIIDVHNERCVHYPSDTFCRSDGTKENLSNMPNPQKVEIVEIVEKVENIDGSMIGCFRYKKRVHFECRDSIGSPIAAEAERIAQNYPHFNELNFDKYYYMFEIVYPDERFPSGLSIGDYGDQLRLVLVAIRDRLTNQTMPYRAVIEEAQRIGLSTPAVLEGPIDDEPPANMGNINPAE